MQIDSLKVIKLKLWLSNLCQWGLSMENLHNFDVIQISEIRFCCFSTDLHNLKT